MSNFKDPILRGITSQCDDILKDLRSLDYVKYCDITNTPSLYVGVSKDDGVIFPLDSKLRSMSMIEKDIDYKISLVVMNNTLSGYKNHYTEQDIRQDLERINNNFNNKRYRVNKKVSFLLNDECLFLTLTFNDKTLSDTSDTTRRRYVRAYLNSLGCSFVCNIDYGKKNGREHYHALVNTTSCNYKEWHKNGAIKGEHVHVSSDNKKLSRYIVKLTSHAIKNTTKNNRIMSKLVKSDDGVKLSIS